MEWREIWLILHADIRDLFRQPSALFNMAILIFILPAVTLTGEENHHNTNHSAKAKSEIPKVALFGSARRLQDRFNTKDFAILIPDDSSDAREYVRSAKANIAIYSPDGFWEKVEQFQKSLSVKKPTMTLYYDVGDLHSSESLDKVTNVLYALGDKLVTARLDSAGIKNQWNVETQYVSPDSNAGRHGNGGRHVADYLTFFVMYAVGFMTSTFGTALFQDELDKKTLGLLLLSPTSKLAISTAKVLVASATSAGFMLCCVAVLLIMMQDHFKHAKDAATAAAFALPPFDSIGFFLLLSLPAILFTASVAIAVATYARKPIHCILLGGLVATVVIGLSAVLGLPGYTMSVGIGLVPISGLVLSMRNVLLGMQNTPLLLVSIASTLAGSVLAILFASRRLESGQVMEGLAQEAQV